MGPAFRQGTALHTGEGALWCSTEFAGGLPVYSTSTIRVYLHEQLHQLCVADILP